VHLTPTEFELLALLMRNEGSPVTHAKLLRTVWGPEYGTELEYLRSFVKTLRQKIEDDPAKPKYILTEPWLGYRFRNPRAHPQFKTPQAASLRFILPSSASPSLTG
jgi:two-component system KDP operon response regulator KdpE